MNNKLIIRTKGAPKNIQGVPTVVLENSDAIAITDSGNNDLKPWDQAHFAFQQDADISFAEPEVDATQNYYPLTQDIEAINVTSKGITPADDYKTFMDYWPSPAQPAIWHLDDGYSQLRAAREEIKALPAKKVVRIAHFDTGYDPNHHSFPKSLIRFDLQRSFVEGEEGSNSAADPFDNGILKMPGHGTGTLSVLAGNRVALPFCQFDDYFGLIDHVEIVPIRIAKGVVLLKSAAFVRAMDYVLNELQEQEDTRIHIITMSMGGVASRAWADVVNEAYDKGIFIVTAAGNNFNKLPSRTLVYPARFNRVVAACGVTYDYSPYHKKNGSFNIMEGNFGPRALMHTAIAAFTPNVPWAPFRYDELVGIRGDGTSSATPQIAAAAALYYNKYYEALEQLPEPWMKVEAIRHALFSSASQRMAPDYQQEVEKYYGKGVLQAAEMLKVAVPAPQTLQKAKKDKVSFAFFRMILGTKSLTAEEQAREDMLETELMQLLLTNGELQKILEEEEISVEDLSDEQVKAFIDAVLANANASDTLKRKLLQARQAL